ncbi:hypothetical protein LZV00_11035 [Pseudomonas kielensis]|uniref:hypothetical protein n=1 Tax=Pseudomonas kielensis TaxID=2762577 RepID=UPI00223F3CB7|nr:hypothetical protein [Pseudomonas kielensis]UZM16204.1 hypothetical protein LZV00_11035 [Pseudomonas kielensis]
MINSLLAVDCYCDLTDQNVDSVTLRSPGLRKIFEGFCGALATEDLIPGSARRREMVCRNVATVVNAASASDPTIIPIEWEPHSRLNFAPMWDERKKFLATEKIEYWTGWRVESRHGYTAFLPLANLWNTHGRTFTNRYFETMRTNFEKECSVAFSLFNRMTAFLTENHNSWPPSTFDSPEKIYLFFVELIKKEFDSAATTDSNLPQRMKSWNKFISRIEKYFIATGIWAQPVVELPRTDAKKIPGNSTHVRKTENGTLVREKLMTDIPLEISHSQAIELLFFEIKQDIQTLRGWAETKVANIMAAFEKRKILAESGISLHNEEYITVESATLENICATFEKESHDINLSLLTRKYNLNCKTDYSATEMAELLAIPSTTIFFPFQCLLILEHPIITNSFLIDYKLYDKLGNMAGFFVEDDIYHLLTEDEIRYLSGNKRRKGPRKSRQKFELSTKAAQIIKNLIALTDAGRKYLRARGDENWKYLFIGSRVAAALPAKAGISKWNQSRFTQISLIKLRTEFEPHTKKRGTGLDKHIFRISLSTIRSSRGLEVYIDSGDTAAMSTALGHETEDSILLTHYLPEPILAYIESRGIRTLQKLIICHALKNSQFLLDAVNLENENSLKTFLSHCNCNIADSYLSDPYCYSRVDTESLTSELLVRIGEETLTTLISLNLAVQQATTRIAITEQALHWSRITELVVSEIELSHDPLLKQHLSAARKAANPNRMGSFIYEYS